MVPREGDGPALEEGDDDHERKPEQAQPAHERDGVPEGARREDPAVEEQGGDLGRRDGQGVEEEGGEERLLGC